MPRYWLHAGYRTRQRLRAQILSLDVDVAQVWGRSRVPRHENALGKQIAATALVFDLTRVTRNTDELVGSGVRILNPFTA